VISAQSSGLFNIDALTFINAGTIEVSHRAQVIFQYGLTTAQLGRVSASTGGGELGFDGTLDNSGATLTLATGEALAGVIDGGTIAGTITMGGNAATHGLTLNGVSVEGAIDLTASYVGLTLADGSSVTGVGGTGPGRINVSGKRSSIFLVNTETIDDATINLSGDPSRSRYGSGVWQLDTAGSGVTLTLGADLTINQTHGGYTGIYGNNVAGGAIVNNGVINVSIQGGHFDIAPMTFTNMGVVKVSNGGMVDLDPTELGNLSSGTLSGGRFEVDAGSMLELAAGQTVTADDATIILSGAGSIFQGHATIDATLATICASGTLEILAGRDWFSKVTLTNAGTLDLGGGTFAPASLNDTGLVSGHGEIDAQVTDAGFIVAAAGALELTEAVIGAGALRIDAAGTLQIDASAATTLTVGFNGAGGVLALASPSAFTAAIAAFASGDTIDLFRTTATSAMLAAGDKLVVTNGAQSVATLQLRGNYVGDNFAVTADGHGGSSITVVTTASAVEPPVARFVQAISALGTGAAAHVAGDADDRRPHAAMLASPQATTA
jgi:hypothetical protein